MIVVSDVDGTIAAHNGVAAGGGERGIGIYGRVIADKIVVVIHGDAIEAGESPAGPEGGLGDGDGVDVAGIAADHPGKNERDGGAVGCNFMVGELARIG